MRLHTLAMAGLMGPILVSCGSSWDIRKGDKLEVGCAESYFYADGDGDGWGDPNSEPEKLCQKDQERGLTASNGRDCDDGLAEITGLVGSSCPDSLVGSMGGAPVPHGGVIVGESEFAYVHGADAPVVRHGAATQACKGWGGSVQDEGGNWVEQGALATFDSPQEVDAALGAIEVEVAAGTGVWAGFIGVEWDGPSIDSGAWSWVDDSTDSVITSAFSWCNDEPTPADFFPLLNTLDPDHVPAINDQLHELRLALVFDGTDWCLGLPWDAIPQAVWDDLQDGTADMGDPFVADVSRYTTSDAHLLCERGTPDPENYRHLAGSGEE